MKRIVDTSRVSEIVGQMIVAELKHQKWEIETAHLRQEALEASLRLGEYFKECPEVDPIVAKEIDPQSLMEVK